MSGGGEATQIGANFSQHNLRDPTIDPWNRVQQGNQFLNGS